MNKKENYLKEKKLLPAMITLFIPAIIAVVISQSAYIIDSLFATQYDLEILKIITLAQPLNLIVSMIGILALAGSIPLITRKLGEGKVEESRKYFMSTLILISGSILIYIAIIILFNDIILLDVLSNPQNLLYDSKMYIYPIIISQLFLGICTTMEAVSIAQGENYKIMFINFISLGINVVLNFLFLYVFGLGIFGIAIATLIAQVIKFLIYLINFSNKHKNIYLNKKYLFNKEYIQTISNTAFAAFGMYFFTITAQLISNKSISLQSNSSELLILKSMVTMMFNFATSFMIGVMQTAQSFIAYNYGAKNYVRMKNSAIIAIVTSESMALIVASIFLINQMKIFNFFQLTESSLAFNISMIAVSFSLFAMPLTFLVTILARSMKRNKVLYYHQWVTNGFILVFVAFFYQFLFTPSMLPSVMPLGQLTMLVFSIPSYYFLIKHIKYLLENNK